MIELFVEKQPVDVNEAFSVMLNMAIDDIKDFSAKNTTYSKTIILPGTNRNNALFGNIFDINAGNDYNSLQPNKSINFNASVSASAIMFADNIQVFKGTFRILEIVIDNGFIEYECSVFGELGGFVSSIAANLLEALDFSAYDHAYTISNIKTSWNNDNGGSGYYYPLIDYGTYSTDKHNWIYKTFRPALFAKQYIDKIFAAAGYTYTCSLFSTDRFKRLIVPNNKKTLQKKSTQQLNINVTPPYNTSYNGDGSNDGTISLDTQTILGNFTASLSNTRYTYTGAAISGQITLDLDISFDTGTSYQAGSLQLKLNGTTTITGSGIYSGVYGSTTNFTAQVTGTLSLSSGDYIEVFFYNFGDAGDYANVYFNKVNVIFGNTGQNYVDINLGETVIVNDTIPRNIQQKDFISSIVKLFNLYIFEDSTNDKHLNIMPFVDFYNGASSVDWSLKVDRSQPLRVKPMSELNSRYYEFKYKQDGDYYNDLYNKRYNQTYGTYKYDSGYEFSKDSTTIELIFSGTPLVGYTGEDKVYPTIFKKSGTTEDNTDSNIRLMLAKHITSVSSFNILDTDGTTILSVPAEYGYAGHFDDPDAPANDLNFGVPYELFYELASGALNVNQFNVYWSSYMAEITDKDSKLLTCKAKLSKLDIANLDFSKLIWIDGSLFRLNKIIDFNASKEDLCSIELLKIINRIY